jgi:Uma2 family endonuclease
MSIALDTVLVTADQFLHLADGRARTELVRGRIVEMNRPYTSHGYFMARIIFLFQQYLQEHDIGRVVGGDAGVVTEHEPDTVRGPDVAFYSYERIPRGPLPEGYWPVTPELVVEIRSPDDRWKIIVQKAAEYLSAGVLTVAVADPQVQRVYLFSADRECAVLEADDESAFPDILPGFAIAVHRLFA